LDVVQLCKGCEFEKDSWGKWPETLDWSKVTDEAKQKYRVATIGAQSAPIVGSCGGDGKPTIAAGDSGRPDAAIVATRWIGHLFWLYHKKEAGCVFHLNDLTPHEWEGLEIVCEEVSRITPKF